MSATNARAIGIGQALRCAQICVLALALQTCTTTTSPAPEPDASTDGGATTEPCQVEIHLDVLETEELTQLVRCSDGEPPPRGTKIDSLPDGASIDPETFVLHWTPGLDQAGHYDITLRVGRAKSAGAIQIDVVDKFTDPDNVPPLDPEHYASEFGLPVVHLGVSPTINDDAHEPASVVYQGHNFADVSAKYRGSTSRKYPKRSYTLKFAKNDPFVDDARGFSGARRIVLTTTFDDNSNLRQRLAYALWNRLSEDHIQIHAFNAVVFIDGQYAGLYVVSDHIDDDFLEDANVFGHGNLYKARKHDANFRLEAPDGDPKPNLHAGYTKEEGLPEDPDPEAFADLDALVQWVATAPDAEFAADFDRRMVQSEFEDWLMFVCLIQATDSAGKNSYLYHDPREDAPEPRWRYLPWDFNASFGQGYRTQRRATTAYPLSDFSVYNEVFARISRDEGLSARLRERFDAALRGAWNRVSVLALFDAWVAEIGPAALRDEQKWGMAYRDAWGGRTDLTTYLEEVDYVRRWIDERWSFMDADL